MRISTILASTASILPTLTTARIIGVNVPATIKPGSAFTASLRTENYIQSVQDISVACGIAPGHGYPGSLGTTVGSTYLGPSKSNVLENINVSVIAPEYLNKGDAVFTAALFSLYGASGMPTISEFNITVTLGNETSEEYVKSDNYYSVST